MELTYNANSSIISKENMRSDISIPLHQKKDIKKKKEEKKKKKTEAYMISMSRVHMSPGT